MGKMTIVAPIVFLVLLASSLVYAVTINVSTVKQIGGTGQVDVICPVDGCQISSVNWIMSTTAPYRVDGVEIEWTPASSSSTYDVYVMVYDGSSNLLASSSVTGVSTSGGSITTQVTWSPGIDPKDIYYVEIVIVEE